MAVLTYVCCLCGQAGVKRKLGETRNGHGHGASDDEEREVEEEDDGGAWGNDEMWDFNCLCGVVSGV